MTSDGTLLPIGEQETGWHYIAIIATVAICGLLANGFAMFILYKGGRLGQAFQQICFSHCVSNSLLMLFFLFYCCPVMFFPESDWSVTANTAKFIGGVMVGLWDVGVYSHLMTSVNRLIAISFPLHYRRILTPFNTKCIIVGVWCMGLLHFTPYLYFSECYLIFSSKMYLWTFAPTTCGWLLGNPFDFWPGITVSILIASMDAFSLIRLKSLKIGPSSGGNVKTRDISYFCQTLLQFVLFVVKKGTFYEMSQLFVDDPIKNNMQLFFTTTFTWELFHFVDGAALIPFHIGDYLRKRKEATLSEITGGSAFGATRSRVKPISSGTTTVSIPVSNKD